MDSLITPDSTAGKRKRSPSSSSNPLSAPAPKASKPSSSQLSINYLARQSHEDLPLLNKDDTLPSLLQLLAQYSNVLDRHESLASNLGARPLGPILIKRFERCFDAPPKVVASHHKGSAGNPEETAHGITWLEVIEFARSHPSQFTLSTFSEGRRVCQFYYPQKQLRVQISEEDFLFINSGRCQELIPPLPIWEDEEKEVATCDVLETKLKELTNVADMVAARTRQLSHRLKGRRAAILERRAEGGSGTPAKAGAPQTTTAPLSSTSAGFTAVNSVNGGPKTEPEPSFAHVRSELLRHFEGLPHNQTQTRPASRHHPVTYSQEATHNQARNVEVVSTQQNVVGDRAASSNSSLSPPPPNAFSIDGGEVSSQPTAGYGMSSAAHGPSASFGGSTFSYTPTKHNFSRPLPPALESSQPFRPLCQAHMDGLPRGHRVMPPCDRCRRLRMDCVKNLTSCAGCTKKHARCHWREVSRDELGALDHLMDSAYADPAAAQYETDGADERVSGDYYYRDEHQRDESDDDDSNPLEDLEALGEKEERENAMAERTREDEDGLRNAKELSRQGLEGSLRSPDPAHVLEGSTVGTEIDVADNDLRAVDEDHSAETAVPSNIFKDSNDIADDAHRLVNGDYSAEAVAPPKHDDVPEHRNLLTGSSADPGDGLMKRDGETLEAVASVEDETVPAVSTAFVPLSVHSICSASPALGGFRAVNESQLTSGMNGSTV